MVADGLNIQFVHGDASTKVISSMTPETETKINEYLTDEAKLYQDWYFGLSQTEKSQYTKEAGVLPKLSEIKNKL